MDSKIVKSINVNTTFDKKTVKENLNKPLIAISGFADELIVANTKYGENDGFSGDFTAVNLITGEVYESNAAFLPKSVTAQIKKKLEDGQNISIEISMTISAIESDKNSLGYAWIANKPMTEERMKRRAALLQKAYEESAKLKLLSAPEKKKDKAA